MAGFEALLAIGLFLIFLVFFGVVAGGIGLLSIPPIIVLVVVLFAKTLREKWGQR